MKLTMKISRQYLPMLLVSACLAFPANGLGYQLPLVVPATQHADKITLTKEGKEKTVTVTVGGQIFTQFRASGFDTPILYLINGPGQIGMTRNWPMKDDVAGEAHDHPHHKSLWFSHEVSGVDFWTEKDGRVVVTSVEIQSQQNTIVAKSKWIPKTKKPADSNKTLFQDTTRYRFGADTSSRWIDATYQLAATEGDIVFQDSKEGTFGLRTHPDLRLTADPKDGVEEVFGSALNSNGETGKSIWGKPAKWVLYYGPIDGTPMSIAIFDHPNNLRHPTTWHARDYGLVAANPFGLHDFLAQPKGTGDYTIKQGDSLMLRYRVVFMAGIATAKGVEAMWEAFASNED